MNPVLAATLIFISGARPILAQFRPADVPAWADSVFRHSPQFAGYDYPDLNPGMAIADFDGDGFDDVAVEITSRDGLQRGLALIHSSDGSVHIVGAGQDVGDGDVEIREWGIVRLRHHKTAIWAKTTVFGDGGTLVWDGRAYHWFKGSRDSHRSDPRR